MLEISQHDIDRDVRIASFKVYVAEAWRGRELTTIEYIEALTGLLYSVVSRHLSGVDLDEEIRDE